MENKEIKLTSTQKIAYDYMVKGQSIFLTGPAGTGKSELLRLYKKSISPKKVIAITSTTGISAILLGGTTLHSYLGIGLGTASTDSLYGKINRTPYLRSRWNLLHTLVIDEVSMLDPALFDKLELLARLVRRSESPFGGIQLILSGDFCQLPVVGKEEFCFESKSWDKCIDKTVYLTEIIRQTDTQFQKCLNEIRIGQLSPSSLDLLKTCVKRDLSNDLGIKPTKIYPTNAQVDRMNLEELDKLNQDDRQFYNYEIEVLVKKKVKSMTKAIDKYRKGCLAMDELELCKDAQVMLLHNLDLDKNLANGSRGIVVDFIEGLPMVKFMNGETRLIDFHTWEYEENDEVVAQIIQIPLKLAWSVTVHKSQGATLDLAIIDMKNIFEYGQAYTALSRVKESSGLCIRNLDVNKIKTHPKVVKYYRELLDDQEEGKKDE